MLGYHSYCNFSFKYSFAHSLLRLYSKASPISGQVLRGIAHICTRTLRPIFFRIRCFPSLLLFLLLYFRTDAMCCRQGLEKICTCRLGCEPTQAAPSARLGVFRVRRHVHSTCMMSVRVLISFLETAAAASIRTYCMTRVIIR